MSDNKSSSGGIGFVGLLTIAFIVLKLCRVIDWPWLWVLSPIWITTAVLALIAAIALSMWWFLAWQERRARAKRK